MAPKQIMAYSTWVWMEFITQILSMVIFVAFWRAIYSVSAEIGGLNLRQTLNYVLLAEIVSPVISTRLIFNFSSLIRDGSIAVELVRPVDLQARFYVEQLSGLLVSLLFKLPLLLFAVLVFGLELPGSPLVWLVFAVALLLGHAVTFFFDWAFGCLAFFTTETWGLSVIRDAVGLFFSGALVPLVMMPGWLQTLAAAMPFAQALAMPVSLLSGIISLDRAPSIWLVQLAWIAGLGLASRVIYRLALRRVTVQGG